MKLTTKKKPSYTLWGDLLKDYKGSCYFFVTLHINYIISSLQKIFLKVKRHNGNCFIDVLNDYINKGYLIKIVFDVLLYIFEHIKFFLEKIIKKKYIRKSIFNEDILYCMYILQFLENKYENNDC